MVGCDIVKPGRRLIFQNGKPKSKVSLAVIVVFVNSKSIPCVSAAGAATPGIGVGAGDASGAGGAAAGGPAGFAAADAIGPPVKMDAI